MNISNLSNERQIFLWTVLGPLMALVTVLLTLYHQTPITASLSLSLCVGIPLCWYAKEWGIAFVTLLLSYLVFFTDGFTAYQMVWHAALSFSIVITLFLCTFGLSEAISLFQSEQDLPFDAKNAKLELKIQTLELYKKELENQKNVLQDELAQEKKKIEALTLEKSSYKIFEEKYNLASNEIEDLKNQLESSKAEIQNLNQASIDFKAQAETQKMQDEHLLDELVEKRAEVLFLRDQLLEMQHELNQLPHNSNEAEILNNDEIIHLKEIIEQKDQEIFNIQFRLQSALDDVREAEIALAKQQDAEILKNQMNQELTDHVDVLKREKELLETSIKSIQIERENLLDVKAENENLKNILNQKQLEELALHDSEKIIAEHAEKIDALNKQLTEKEKQYATSISTYKQEVGEKNRQLSDLQERLIEKDRQLSSLQNSLKSFDGLSSKNELLASTLEEKMTELDNIKIDAKNYKEEIDQLNKTILETERKKQQELEGLKNELSLKIEQLAGELQKTLEEKEKHFNVLQSALNDMESIKSTKDDLEKQLALKFNEVEALNQTIDGYKKEIKDLSDLFNENVTLSDKQIAELKKEFSDKSKELASLQNLLNDQELTHKQIKDELEKRLLGSLKDLEKLNNDLRSQSKEKSILENDFQIKVQDLQKTIDAQKQEIEVLKNAPAANVVVTETNEYKNENALRRRFEGMYLQLKEQFNEKSKTLDATRKELFLTQENLEQLKKELDENSLYAPDAQIENLSKYIVQMQAALDKENKELMKENEILSDMILNLNSRH